MAKKDQDLAAARKEADDKTALAEQKLASVDQLEKENTMLQTALTDANRLTANWKKKNLLLGEEMEGIARRRDDLESYLRSLAKRLYIKLEGAPLILTILYFLCRLNPVVVGLSLGLVCKILSELRRGDRADRNRFGSNQLSGARRSCHEPAPTGIPR